MPGATGGRIRLAELNDQLSCKLCNGYFIDATTIVECLHSFCKSCIVKYLRKNKYCPICEVQVHECKPLLGIKPDYTLQDIVYKLVPGCYQNEMRCRREFYDKHPEAKIAGMSPEARGEPIESHIYSADELLNLSLEYYNPTYIKGTNIFPFLEDSNEQDFDSGKNLSKIYLRCPAAVTVYHLQKLIRAKYELNDAYRIDFMYKEEPLCTNYTLMDVMYIYHWRRKVPLNLNYRIFKPSPKRSALSDENINMIDNGKNEISNQTSHVNHESKVHSAKKNNSQKDTASMSFNNKNNSNGSHSNNNVPMTLDDSNQSALACDVQNSVNSSSVNTLKTLELNPVPKQPMTNIAMTIQTNVENSASTCSMLNIARTFPPSNNSNRDRNNDNNNNNNTNATSNSNNQTSSSQENSKENSQMTVILISSRPEANLNSPSKSLVKRMEMSKGKTLNKIYTKLGTSGSKINDICAKIRKLSKKKSKIEKSKTAIPSLVKITKKSATSTPSDTVKRVSNVPIYSPNRLGKSKNDVNEEPTPSPSAKDTPITTIISTTILTTTTSSSLMSSSSSGLSNAESMKMSQMLLDKKRFENVSEALKSAIGRSSYVKIERSITGIPNNQASNKAFIIPGTSESISQKKPTIPKPPRAFKTKPIPKYRANSDISIKPLHNIKQDTKDGKHQQTGTMDAPKNALNVQINPMVNIDSHTLPPVVSTSANSAIISIPNYTPNRSFPFKSPSHVSTLLPLENSSDIFSNGLYLPPATPNPRLMHPNFSSPFISDSNKTINPLIRPPIVGSPSNMFHINFMPVPGNLCQDPKNIPSTTAVTCPPGLTIRPVFSSVQSTSSTSNVSSASSSNLPKMTPGTFHYDKSEAVASTSLKSIPHKKSTPTIISVVNLPATTRVSSSVPRLSKSSHSTAARVSLNTALANLSKLFKSEEKTKKITVDEYSEYEMTKDNETIEDKYKKEMTTRENNKDDINDKDKVEKSTEKQNNDEHMKDDDDKKPVKNIKSDEQNSKLESNEQNEIEKNVKECVKLIIGFNKDESGDKDGNDDLDLPKDDVEMKESQ